MLGLLAAVGFSIAMWVFIAVAVLGLILKVVGPRGAEQGLAAAGISLPEGFGFDKPATEKDPANGWPDDATSAGSLTTLDGRLLGATKGEPAGPAKSPAPATPPATPTPTSTLARAPSR